MNIYNKPLFFIGFISGMAGVSLNYFYDGDAWALKVILMTAGTIIMLTAFRKPKDQKNGTIE